MGSRSVWFRLWVLGALLAGIAVSLRADAPEKRLALVIGNAGYASGALPNCRNDAADMAAALRTLGFTVTQTVDQDRRQMTEAVRAVAARCDSDTLALVYFSGHGVQVDGKNYLIPVRADIGKESDVEFEALQAKWVLQQLEERKPKAALLILDACRDNPLPASAKSTAKGLIPIKTRKGSLVAFAADEGETASANDSGRDSLYTQELLRNLTTPGLKILDIFVKTRAAVATKSGDRQNPREDNGLVDNFVLAPDSLVVDSSSHQAGEIRLNPADGAEMVWVPGGEFLMGEDASEIDRVWTKFGWPAEYKMDAKDVSPEHRVRVDGCWMYRGPVTNAQYRKFCQATAREPPQFHDSTDNNKVKATWDDARFNGDRQPVVGVSWEDARAYCAWAKVRLPTEAEWEHAARGTHTGLSGHAHQVFAWGDELPTGSMRPSNVADVMARAKYSFLKDIFEGYTDGYAETSPVGAFPANEFNLYDIDGNVTNWCSDWYAEDYYGHSPSANPPGPEENENIEFRVVRGGSWEDSPPLLEVSYRGRGGPDVGDDELGFRPARTP